MDPYGRKNGIRRPLLIRMLRQVTPSVGRDPPAHCEPSVRSDDGGGVLQDPAAPHHSPVPPAASSVQCSPSGPN